MGLYDVYLKRRKLLELTNDDILVDLQRMFPDRKLYSISLDWRKNERYFLKARGTLGDIIVGWSDKNGRR